MLGDCSRHRADRTEAENGHGLSGEVDDLGRVYRVPQRVEKCADADRNVPGIERNHVRRGYGDVLGESAIAVKSENSCVSADVAFSTAALGTGAADDVHLCRDVGTGVESGIIDPITDPFDEAAEFVAVHSRRSHRAPDRRIPLVDVFVGSADRCRGHAYQNLVRLRRGYWNRSHLGSFGTRNGTAELLADDPRVFTYSIHVGRNFPSHKTTSTLDIETVRYVEGEMYLHQLFTSLAGALDAFAPDLVIWISGADNHRNDRFGQMHLSLKDIQRRDEVLLGAFIRNRIPVAVLYGGGYNRQPEFTAKLHRNTIATAKKLATQYRGL
jgi:hypothetical protein